jgi:tRNA pseudouridine13 synthase
MKLKQQSEDFFVEELTDVTPGPAGDFALYRLEKRGWTTPDALLAIRRRWQLDARRLSFGGLKDGHVGEPFVSRDIRANRFRLVLRSLSDHDVEMAQTALTALQRDGVPNYFDDQRFGSVTDGKFVAKALVRGEFEQALRLAIAGQYEHDRTAQKQEKAILTRHWGDWHACKAKLQRGHTLTLVDYLAHHPGDYRGAIARLRPELRGLYLSAYQSHLWNRMLARWLRHHLRPDQLMFVDLRMGKVPMYRRLSEAQRLELEPLTLPLPTSRGEVDRADPRIALMERVLEEEGLTRDQLKVKGLREVFFSRGERAAWCLPEALQSSGGEDDKNARRRKLTLEFALPRGCYATLLVKRILAKSHQDITTTE